MRKGYVGIREEIYAAAFLAENVHAGGRSGDRRGDFMERRRYGVCGVAAGGVCERSSSDALQAQQLLQLCSPA